MTLKSCGAWAIRRGEAIRRGAGLGLGGRDGSGGTAAYTFTTATTCTGTYTRSDGSSNDRTYTYDVNEKRVYLKEVVSGPDRNTYYQHVAGNTTQTGNFATVDENIALQVNSRYDGEVQRFVYNAAEKTLTYR
jgi:hypothetical protein